MEELYYVLDTQTNIAVVENLTLDEVNQWLEQNGIASIHVARSH